MKGLNKYFFIKLRDGIIHIIIIAKGFWNFLFFIGTLRIPNEGSLLDLWSTYLLIFILKSIYKFAYMDYKKLFKKWIKGDLRIIQ